MSIEAPSACRTPCRKIADTAGIALIILGIYGSALFWTMSPAVADVRSPVILGLISLWPCWPHAVPRLQALQAAVLLAMACLAICAAHQVHWPLSGASSVHEPIRVSAALPVAVLLACGRGVWRPSLAEGGCRYLLPGKAVYWALCVLVVHLAGVVAILHWHYGYGGEYAAQVGGQLALCTIVLTCAQPLAERWSLRCVVAPSLAMSVLSRSSDLFAS